MPVLVAADDVAVRRERGERIGSQKSRSYLPKQKKPTTDRIRTGVQLNIPCSEEKHTFNRAGESQNQRSV